MEYSFFSFFFFLLLFFVFVNRPFRSVIPVGKCARIGGRGHFPAARTSRTFNRTRITPKNQRINIVNFCNGRDGKPEDAAAGLRPGGTGASPGRSSPDPRDRLIHICRDICAPPGRNYRAATYSELII